METIFSPSQNNLDSANNLMTYKYELNRPTVAGKSIFVCIKHMMGYNRILVPHAGTLAGDRALEHALNIRLDQETKITLLHVVVPLSTPSSFSISANRLDLSNSLTNCKIQSWRIWKGK